MKKTRETIFFVSLFIIFLLGTGFLIGQADTNIDPNDRWAWSDTAGWWDFYSTNSVEVGTSTLHGYATSSIGEMALNCDSAPSGNICGDSDFAVENTDASGNLSGCAWNDTIGWISFDCADYDCQGGNIWNDIEGWISFNCANNSSCNISDHKVNTSWRTGRLTGYLISSVIDSGGNVTLNSVIWQGSQPSGTSVDFQIAVATSTEGPWNYKGPDDTDSTWFGAECPTTGVSDPAAGPNKAICLDKDITVNKRYLRYRVRLRSNTVQSQTPVIEDIILNWSR